jgi:hypothetical protein
VNIDWVIPCRYVEIHDNLGTIVGAGVDKYFVAELPATLQVILAIRLLLMEEELDEAVQHRSVSRVRDPRGEVLSEIAGDFAIGGSHRAPEWLAGVMLATVVVFEVTEAGTYTIEHDVDDSVSSLPIHIVHGARPE